MAPAQEPAGSPAEIMHIDGARNPELIPQWSAWGFAFRVFAGGFRQLPSSMIPHVTSAEHALILKESDSVQKIDAACLERHRKILAGQGRKNARRARQGGARAEPRLPRGNAARPRSAAGHDLAGGPGSADRLRRIDEGRDYVLDCQEGSPQVSGTRITPRSVRGDV